MARIKRFLRKDGYHGELGFLCPGCNQLHFVRDEKTEGNGPIWTFNDNFEKPTIRASVLTWSYAYNSKTGNHDIIIDRCHSFITDGKIEFLHDCMHQLVGKTIELPEIN